MEYFIWREYLGGQRLLRETGPRAGIGGEGTYVAGADMFPLRLRGELLFGSVAYKGATMGEDSLPVRTTTDYFAFKVEADAGYRLHTSVALIEPFAGFGYRAWSRDLNDTKVLVDGAAERVSGYVEDWTSTYVYTGVRLRTPATMWPRKGIFVEAELKYPLSTKNTVDELGVAVKPGSRGTPYVEAGAWYGPVKGAIYYDRHHYGRSPEVEGLFQPESDADIVGFKIGYCF